MEDMLQSATYFAHLMANVLMEGKATSNASPNIELGDRKLCLYLDIFFKKLKGFFLNFYLCI